MVSLTWLQSRSGLFQLLDSFQHALVHYRDRHGPGRPYLRPCGSPKAAEMDDYLKGGHFARTPVFRWVMSNTGVCTWRWVEEDRAAGRLSPTELDALDINDKLGIKAGLAISFPETCHRIKAAFGLMADVGMSHDDVDAIWDTRADEITAIAHMMHLKIASLPLRTSKRALTQRQREALEWVADGKTSQDIAILMGVSAAMVEKHLRLARDALDVETTAQAVAKATLLNVIFTQSDPS